MILKTGTKWAIAGIISALFTAAGVYYLKNQIDLMMDFCYKISDFKVNSFRKNNISISLFLKITNQSKITIKIEKYNFNVLINGYKIGVVKNNTPQIWESKATSPIAIDINSDLSKINIPLLEILNMLNDYIGDRSKIIFTFNGKLSIRISKYLFIKNHFISLNYSLKQLLENNETPTTCTIK